MDVWGKLKRRARSNLKTGHRCGRSEVAGWEKVRFRQCSGSQTQRAKARMVVDG